MRETTDVDKEIGLRIRAVRVGRRWSQEELATRAGVSHQQFSKYERGLNRVPAATLSRIAEMLETSVLDLLPTSSAGDGCRDVGGALFARPQGRRIAELFVKLPLTHQESLLSIAEAMAAPSLGELRRALETA